MLSAKARNSHDAHIDGIMSESTATKPKEVHKEEKSSYSSSHEESSFEDCSTTDAEEEDIKNNDGSSGNDSKFDSVNQRVTKAEIICSSPQEYSEEADKSIKCNPGQEALGKTEAIIDTPFGERPLSRTSSIAPSGREHVESDLSVSTESSSDHECEVDKSASHRDRGFGDEPSRDSLLIPLGIRTTKDIKNDEVEYQYEEQIIDNNALANRIKVISVMDKKQISSAVIEVTQVTGINEGCKYDPQMEISDKGQEEAGEDHMDENKDAHAFCSKICIPTTAGKSAPDGENILDENKNKEVEEGKVERESNDHPIKSYPTEDHINEYGQKVSIPLDRSSVTLRAEDEDGSKHQSEVSDESSSSSDLNWSPVRKAPPEASAMFPPKSITLDSNAREITEDPLKEKSEGKAKESNHVRPEDGKIYEAKEQNDPCPVRKTSRPNEALQKRALNTAPVLVSTLNSTLYSRQSEFAQKLNQINFQTIMQLQECREQLSLAQDQLNAVRQCLLSGINGGVQLHDRDKYSRITLSDLLRIRLQEGDQSYTACPRLKTSDRVRPLTPGITFTDQSRASSPSSENIKIQTKKLLERIKELEADLCVEREKAQEIARLKGKVNLLNDRLRAEKMLRYKVNEDLLTEKNACDTYDKQTEKLLQHVESEKTAKSRLSAELAKNAKELQEVKSHYEALNKKFKKKDDSIEELKNTVQIKEEQMKLMDEKYHDLRLKLDYTRDKSARVEKQKDEELKTMRAKFAFAMRQTGQDKSLSIALLDEVQLPHNNSTFSLANSTDTPEGKTPTKKSTNSDGVSKLGSPNQSNAASLSVLERSKTVRSEMRSKDGRKKTFN